jgi:hypothetical protein
MLGACGDHRSEKDQDDDRQEEQPCGRPEDHPGISYARTPRDEVVESPTREKRDAEKVEDRQPAEVGLVESWKASDEPEQRLDAEHHKEAEQTENRDDDPLDAPAQQSDQCEHQGRAPA